jgi:hypothetical protein
MIAQPWTTHRVLDLTKLKTDLDYHDVGASEQGLAVTAKWLKDDPLRPLGAEEKILQDPFEYSAEDELIATWKKLCEKMPRIKFENEPGYTGTYSGSGGKPRSARQS